MEGLALWMGPLISALENELDQVPRSVFNPLGVCLATWFGLLVLKSLSVLLIDPIVLTCCKMLHVKKLPSREPKPIMKGLEAFAAKDFCFLAINQAVESVALQYFAQFALDNSKVVRAAEQLTFGNTVVAVYLIFLVDDFIYYWAHRAMHLPSLYPYIHKHHHRQALPFRGYFDAANEHPLEQVIGLSALMAAFHAVNEVSPWGLHAFSVGVFFILYASVAFLNHSEYDVQLGPLCLGYTVRAHETHHRIGRGCYAQNTMLWDKLFGTFVEYHDGRSKSEKAN
eukprot:gnl/MRDRNA2_/MRDRNA2_128209_c0_seq1.p1 gnl/MRDRNA2_/MRDRNA2_128209_c0~~gnl/MRDRNA2_/MRDRNA2_128209_c0_seq1.p1  ORF type:complete len:283 (-),score=46.33 gnl/MRDRNA2_/MRDRNA2_128209_c0_seq1:265-1113(-)